MDPAALGLQDQSLHMLQQFIDEVDVGVSSLRHLVLGLGGGRVGQPTSFPLSSPPGEALQYFTTGLTQYSEQQGAEPVLLLLYHMLEQAALHVYTHISRASSTVLPRRGTGPVLLSAAVNKGQGNSLAQTTKGQIRRRTSSPMFTFLD